MPSSRITVIFDTIVKNRERIYRTLATMSNEDLWRRPANGKWSIGENLEHLYKISRTMRWIARVILLLKGPLARLRKNNAYTADIEDLFKGSNFHMRAMRINIPRYRIENPFQLASLQVDLGAEEQRWNRLLRNLPDNVAGNLILPHPVYGPVNFLQFIQVMVYHEIHHFRAITRILEPVESPEAEDTGENPITTSTGRNPNTEDVGTSQPTIH